MASRAPRPMEMRFATTLGPTLLSGVERARAPLPRLAWLRLAAGRLQAQLTAHGMMTSSMRRARESAGAQSMAVLVPVPMRAREALRWLAR